MSVQGRGVELSGFILQEPKMLYFWKHLFFLLAFHHEMQFAKSNLCEHDLSSPPFLNQSMYLNLSVKMLE